jgi:hypothetical protein
MKAMDLSLSLNANYMKKSIILSLVVVIVLLQGCIVKSIHPFFKERDVVFRKSLVGEWQDQDGSSWNIHQNKFKQNSYELHYSKKGRSVSLLGHLFQLNGDLYLDMIPIEDNSEDMLVFDLHMVPTHSIAKVETLTDGEVELKWFNDEWLRAMFEQNKIKISHEIVLDDNQEKGAKEEGMYVLTASTDELQKFIIKYGHEDKAYDSENSLELRLKRN